MNEKIDDLDRNTLHLQSVRKTLCNHRQNMVFRPST